MFCHKVGRIHFPGDFHDANGAVTYEVEYHALKKGRLVVADLILYVLLGVNDVRTVSGDCLGGCSNHALLVPTRQEEHARHVLVLSGMAST